MAETTTSPKRRKRADLKQLVLTAGIEILERDGLGFGSEDLTYAKVFDHLEQTRGIRVTRGSVHERIWDNQRDFQLEVLAEVAEWDFAASIDQTRVLLREAVGGADLSTHAARAEMLRSILRVAAYDNLQASESVDKWSLWQATVSSILANPINDEDFVVVKQAATKSYAKLLDAYLQLYTEAVGLMGLRWRPFPGLTDDEVRLRWTSTALALADGFAIRMSAGLIRSFDLPTGTNGAMERWDDVSFALWRASESYVENPPD